MASYPSRVIKVVHPMICDSEEFVGCMKVPPVPAGLLFAAALSVGLLSATPLSAASPNTKARSIDEVDTVMWFDPGVERAVWHLDHSDAPVDLWMKALRRGEVQLQCLAIDTFVVAHQREMEGLEVVVDELVQLLGVEDQVPEIVHSAVKALIEFQAKDQARLLSAVAEKHGVSIASIVDPALARWESDVSLEVWRKRIKDPETSRRMLVLAIQGVAALGRTEAADSLRNLAVSRQRSLAVRLAAATGLGTIQRSGLEKEARAMIENDDSSSIEDLIAIRLLSQHTSKEAVAIISELIDRDQTAVQAAALAVLFEIDPSLLLGFAEDQIDNPDVNVRRLIAKSLVLSRDRKRIASMASLLDDVNPSLRQEMADALVRLAVDSELRDEVIQQTVQILQGESWRGCEQATLVLVNLEHRECGDRLVQLIHHERGEVMVTAAWGLRRFAAKQHLPRMLDRAKEAYQGFVSGGLSLKTSGAEELVAQLFMAFGQMRYQPADELLREYIPKRTFLGDKARSAAAWALGYLYEDTTDDASSMESASSKRLAKMLVGRLTDVSSDYPEVDDVRRMCAVSLGRMNSSSALSDLRRFTGLGYGTVSQACQWSITRMTGETFPALQPVAPKHHVDWFLVPAEMR